MKNVSYFKMLIERFNSESPEFFKVIIKWAAYIGAIGTALVAAPEFNLLPEVVQTIGGYMVTIGVVAALVSSVTTKNAQIREKSEEAAK